MDHRLGHESSEATRVTRHEPPVCTSSTEQPQRASIPRGEDVDEMIYALSHVVCHRIHSGGANGDVQQRWAAVSAPPNPKELFYYCACHLEPSPCCIQDSMPWGTKACFESRLPAPSRARYVIHWPDLSRCISSSGLFEVPFLLPLYRIDRTSLLTTWRCSETALLPLTLG